MHDFHVWSISVGKYALSAHITVDRDPMPVMKMAQQICYEIGIDHVTFQMEDLANMDEGE